MQLIPPQALPFPLFSLSCTSTVAFGTPGTFSGVKALIVGFFKNLPALGVPFALVVAMFRSIDVRDLMGEAFFGISMVTLIVCDADSPSGERRVGVEGESLGSGME